MIFLRNLSAWTWAWAGFLASVGLAGQDPEPPMFPPERPSEVLAPGIHPDVYLLRNAEGETVLVPRVGYEEYERSIREASGEPQDLPPPALSQLDLVIEPQADFARVTVDATARLSGPNKSWLAIPLGLPQLQWLPSADGSDRTGIVAQSNGYVWRIEPGTQRERRLSINTLCKMTASNSGNSIRLDLPSTATIVRLRLPKGDWELTASGGGTEVIEPFRNIDESAVATVRTTANSLNLVWTRKQERQALTAVEATSLTKFSSSDDGSQIKAVTTWSLRGPTSLGGKKFALTLPANGKMRDASNAGVGFSGYRMLRRDSGEDPSLEAEATSWIFDIEVDESYARTDLDLALDWQIVGQANPQALTFEAPKIEGVQAHSGMMECIIPRGIVFQWNAHGDARLVRQGPSTDGSSAMVYAFRFASPGANVVAAWQSLINRPRMRSAQQIEVREGFAVLQGRLEFGSDPTQLPLLQLEWSGWQLDRLVVAPSMLELDRSTVQAADERGRAAVPLNASLFIDTVREAGSGMANPANPTREIETADRSSSSNLASNSSAGAAQPTYAIEYSLSQRLPANGTSLSLPLPQVSWLNPDTQERTARTPPGTLRVQSWIYRFRETEPNTMGLAWLPSTAPAPATGSAPVVLLHQVAESPSQVLWNAEYSRRPSSTAVIYEVQQRVGETSIFWSHRWSCRSLGGPPDTLKLLFPKGMIPREFQVDGKPSEIRSWKSNEPKDDPRYDSYSISIPDLSRGESPSSEFLITATSESPLSWNEGLTVQVRLEMPVLLSANPEDLLVVESATARERSEGLRELDPENPLWEGILTKPSPLAAAALDIETEWVQTVLNAIYQRDRYVARFTTRRDWIDISVPSSLRKELEIVLDGKRVVPTDSSQGGDWVRIEISPSEQLETHVVEVFTLRSSPEGIVRKISLNSPRLEAKKSASALIWQVIVPRTEHLVWNSSELAPLYRWEWKDIFFARTSLKSQQTMESELGATPQPAVELLQTNQYDLSTLSGSESLSAWFIPRSLIWLPVAALALMLAMSLGETALLSRPWLWIGFVAVWLVFSQWYWDMSILVAQTMFGALSMAIFYMLIRWLLNRRARRRSIFVSRSSGAANPYSPLNAPVPRSGAPTKELSSKAMANPSVDAHALEEGS